MMIKAGSTSRMVTVYAFDATTGLPYVTAAFGDAGISLWYRRGTAGAIVAITPATQTVAGAYSSGGFILLNAADNAYRFDIPDAAFAAGVDEVEIGGHATAWKLIGPTVQLVGYDPRTELTTAALANLDAAVSTRSTYAGGDTAGTATLLTRVTALLQTKAEADTAHGLLATAASTAASAIRAALGLASANLDTQLDALPTAAEIADAISDEALSGHTTAGTAGKAWSDAAASGNPWDTDIAGETFTDGTAGDILQGLAGGTVYATGSTPNTDADLYIRRGDTVAVTIGDLTGLAAGWDVLWVTIKRSEHDADSAAILQVRLNVATATLPGLIYINGQTPTDAGVAATDAWISDVDAGASTLVLNIKPAASLLLPARGSLWFDVQQLDGTTITSLTTGEKTAEIGADITRAVS